jgi:hypothetical protein
LNLVLEKHSDTLEQRDIKSWNPWEVTGPALTLFFLGAMMSGKEGDEKSRIAIRSEREDIDVYSVE